MGSLDRQHSAVHNGLVALAVKAEAGDLGQEIVEPASRPAMRVGAHHGDIRLAVRGVGGSQPGQTLEDAVADGRVSRLDIEDEIDEAVVRADLANDE